MNLYFSHSNHQKSVRPKIWDGKKRRFSASWISLISLHDEPRGGCGGALEGVAARVEYTPVANSADRSLINRSHYQATSECAWPRLCAPTMYTGMYLKPLSSEFPWPIQIPYHHHHHHPFHPPPSVYHGVATPPRFLFGRNRAAQPSRVIAWWSRCYVIYKCPREMTRSSISSLKHGH